MTPSVDREGTTCAETMPLSYIDEGGATLLHASGELDIYRAQAFREELLGALAGGRTSLVLDLSAVTALDSAGVQLLLAARVQATEAGGSLRLRAPSAVVSEVLACLGLCAHFELPTN